MFLAIFNFVSLLTNQNKNEQEYGLIRDTMSRCFRNVYSNQVIAHMVIGSLRTSFVARLEGWSGTETFEERVGRTSRPGLVAGVRLGVASICPPLVQHVRPPPDKLPRPPAVL